MHNNKANINLIGEIVPNRNFAKKENKTKTHNRRQVGHVVDRVEELEPGGRAPQAGTAHDGHDGREQLQRRPVDAAARRLDAVGGGVRAAVGRRRRRRRAVVGRQDAAGRRHQGTDERVGLARIFGQPQRDPVAPGVQRRQAMGVAAMFVLVLFFTLVCSFSMARCQCSSNADRERSKYLKGIVSSFHFSV